MKKRLLPALIIAALLAALILPNVQPAIAEERAGPPASPLFAQRTVLLQTPLRELDDTTIVSTTPTTNYGTLTSLLSGQTAGVVDRVLLKFDLSKLPADANITSASLHLRIYADNSTNTRTFRVYRVKRAWAENEATWNNYATGLAWQTAGAGGANDRDATDIGSASIEHNAALNSEVVFTLNAGYVQDWIDGDLTNNGVLIQADTESSDRWQFYSDDITTNRNYAPALTVTFTSATPYDAITDEISSGTILANDASGDPISTTIGELYALTISGGPFSYGGGESLYDPAISTDGSTWYSLWSSPAVVFAERINTYYIRVFFEATTTSTYLRANDCGGCFGNNSGSFGWTLNGALPSSDIPVWQTGNYLIDGSVESYPYLGVGSWFPWSASSMFDVTRQSSWSYGGDTAPMCNSNFAMLRASLGNPSYIEQEFLFSGGDMFITLGLRTQGSAQMIVQIKDPFDAWTVIDSFITQGATNWKAFNYLRNDQWLGKYKLRVTAFSMGAQSFAAVDGLSVGEGWYQPCDYNGTVLTPPSDIPGVLVEKGIPEAITEDGNALTGGTFEVDESAWYIPPFAMIQSSPTNSNHYMALGIAIVDESPVDPVVYGNILRSKNWIEVRPNAAVAKGFSAALAKMVVDSEVYLSAQMAFSGQYQAAIFSEMEHEIYLPFEMENIETGVTYDMNYFNSQPGASSVIDQLIFGRMYFKVSVPPGRYRLITRATGRDVEYEMFLDNICVGPKYILALEDCTNADLLTDPSIPINSAYLTQQAQLVQDSAAAAQTALAMQTQVVGTQIAQAQITQTALIASGNQTQIALATQNQSSALTATPRAALTGTAFVQQFRATLTQIAGATQTRAAQVAINNATAVALRTQQAQLMQTAWANATQSGQLTAQANYQATLYAQATAAVVAQPTVQLVQTNAAATNAAAATQLAQESNATTQYQATLAAQYQATINAIAQGQINAQLTTIALLTAAPNVNATLQFQATQIAQQYATLIATYQALATQQVLELPITQPMPESAEITADVDCTRPTNAINIPAWIDYEVCRILWFFTPNQYNMNQIDSAIDPLQNYEPFGSIMEINGMREDLLMEWQKYDWYTTGLEGSQDTLPVIAESDYATPPPGDVFTLMQRATEVPLLYGNIDFSDPALNYVFSTTCTLRIADLIGPYITPPICFLVDIFRTHGYLPIARLILDLGAIMLFIGYVNNTIRELLGEAKQVERVIESQVRRSR